MTAEDIAAIVRTGNDAALDWYALTHNQTLPSMRPPSSVLGQVIGTDFGRGDAYGYSSIGGSTIGLIALVVVAVLLLRN